MDNYLDLMRARREQILERFYAALDRAGRPHDAARLIAVSKTVGVDETVAAIQAGYRHFAENRPQELVRKLAGLAEHPELPEVRFDMIGNLQTNKINAVLGSAELIHSVSSLHLAQAISSRAARKIEAGELSGPQRVLIEVNVSGEESKGGFSPDEVRDAAGELAERAGPYDYGPAGEQGCGTSHFCRAARAEGRAGGGASRFAPARAFLRHERGL